VSAHDNVEYRDTCANCGAELTWFQTGGYGRTYPVLPSDVEYFYTACGKCKTWHDYKVVPTAYTVVRVVGAKRPWEVDEPAKTDA